MSQNSRATTTLGWILIIAFGLTPIIKHTGITEHFLIIRTLVWSALLSGAGIFIFSKNKSETKIPILSILWLVFTAWMTLTGFIAEIYSSPEWLLTSSRFALYGAVLLLGSVAIQRKYLTYRDFSRGLVVYGIVGGALGLGAYLQVEDLLNIRAPFGHKNFLSAAMLLSAAGSLYSLWDKDKRWKNGAMLSLGLSVLLIILLKTRGVWIGTFAATIFLLVGVIVFKVKDAEKTLIPTKVIGIVFGIILMGLVGVSGLSKSKDTVVASDNIELRFLYWSHSMKMVAEHPLEGVGAGQWKINFPKYGLAHTNTRVSNGETAMLRPHNDYVWMFAEGGIPGGLLYIVFFGGVMGMGILKLKKSQDREEHKILLSSVALFIGFSAYAMGEFPIERVDLAIPAMFAAAFILHETKSYHFKASAANGLILVLALFSTFVTGRRFPQEAKVSIINIGNDNQDPVQILNTYKDVDLDIVDVDYVANPIPYFAGLSNSVTATMRGHDPRLFAEAESAFERALEIHPWHVATYSQYGKMYFYQKKYDKAMEMYNKGLEISPFNITIRLDKATIFMETGNAEGAALMMLSIVGQDQNPKYQNLVVQSLRRIRGPIKNTEIQQFISSVNIAEMKDPQLYNAFIRYRDSIKAQ
ncbi:O-antigen ligase family protein [Phaeocystidibacter marisrubri]|uniref:Tetratricopeptide repeat protein n=1 Tax=Phaeocystidibacter marisrubri TaxID=1577780 RepID=A0A6L3ZCS7_9FLAO|nr:O-antigen ligase family protein [Phaeocystidibacter marisrubri]KAB2815671.1 tetratricopeptide repeat protein [Phaeocystidibacter marisrubri]GGH65098.1 hypothetical protein GCM10011318_01770 [Phaeocystidibacter marisrubri]